MGDGLGSAVLGGLLLLLLKWLLRRGILKQESFERGLFFLLVVAALLVAIVLGDEGGWPAAAIPLVPGGLLLGFALRRSPSRFPAAPSLATLDPEDRYEVRRLVKAGEVVADPALAPAVVEHARAQQRAARAEQAASDLIAHPRQSRPHHHHHHHRRHRRRRKRPHPGAGPHRAESSQGS